MMQAGLGWWQMAARRARTASAVGMAALVAMAALGCAGTTPAAKDPSSSDDEGDKSSDRSEKSSGGSSGPATAGKPAPDLSIQSMNGKGKIRLGALSGKIVIVDFWATWCEPCKKSFPALEAVARRHGSDVAVVGIAVNDEPEGVTEFAKDYGATFAVGWDKGHTIAERWKVETMPTSYVVDASGTVRYVHAGFHEGEEAAWEKEISQLLAKRGSSDRSDRPERSDVAKTERESDKSSTTTTTSSDDGAESGDGDSAPPTKIAPPPTTRPAARPKPTPRPKAVPTKKKRKK